MIPLTFLYDEYIDRLKFTEQKKNPFEYIVPSPTSGVGTMIFFVLVFICVCVCVRLCGLLSVYVGLVWIMRLVCERERERGRGRKRELV